MYYSSILIIIHINSSKKINTWILTVFCTAQVLSIIYCTTRHTVASKFSIHSNEAIKLRTLKQNITFKVGFYFRAKKQLPCSDLLMIQRGAKRQTGRGRKTWALLIRRKPDWNCSLTDNVKLRHKENPRSNTKKQNNTKKEKKRKNNWQYSKVMMHWIQSSTVAHHNNTITLT